MGVLCLNNVEIGRDAPESYKYRIASPTGDVKAPVPVERYTVSRVRSITSLKDEEKSRIRWSWGRIKVKLEGHKGKIKAGI